jgi:hypothetical protein
MRVRFAGAGGGDGIHARAPGGHFDVSCWTSAIVSALAGVQRRFGFAFHESSSSSS